MSASLTRLRDGMVPADLGLVYRAEALCSDPLTGRRLGP